VPDRQYRHLYTTDFPISASCMHRSPGLASAWGQYHVHTQLTPHLGVACSSGTLVQLMRLVQIDDVQHIIGAQASLRDLLLSRLRNVRVNAGPCEKPNNSVVMILIDRYWLSTSLTAAPPCSVVRTAYVAEASAAAWGIAMNTSLSPSLTAFPLRATGICRHRLARNPRHGDGRLSETSRLSQHKRSPHHQPEPYSRAMATPRGFQSGMPIDVVKSAVSSG
jgi:hypothetical protein